MHLLGCFPVYTKHRVPASYFLANPKLFKLQNKGANYGFVEYDDPGAAEAAMAQLNSRKVLNSVSVLRHPVLFKTVLTRDYVGNPRQLGLPVQ